MNFSKLYYGILNEGMFTIPAKIIIPISNYIFDTITNYKKGLINKPLNDREKSLVLQGYNKTFKVNGFTLGNSDIDPFNVRVVFHNDFTEGINADIPAQKINIYVNDIRMSDLAENREITEHEILHVLQGMIGKQRKLGKYGGLPKKSMLSTVYDVHGYKIGGKRLRRIAHPLRDVEFHPNLTSMIIRLNNILEKNPAFINKEELIKGLLANTSFADMGLTNGKNSYTIALSTLNLLKRRSPLKWKYYVKQLYKELK